MSMNASEFQGFISSLNDIWPNSFTNQKKNEYLFNLVKWYEYYQMIKVFDKLVVENHAAPSIAKIVEAIKIIIAEDKFMRDKREFIERIEKGEIWCSYCGSTGFVNITDEECDPKKGPKTCVLRCSDCIAAKKLRLSELIPEYHYLTTHKRYVPRMFPEISPYKEKENGSISKD